MGKITVLMLPLVMLILITAEKVSCMSVQPVMYEEALGVVMMDIDFPEDHFRRELRSGIKTTISISVVLMNKQTVTHECGRLISIVYDLWDEVYYIKELSEQGELDTGKSSYNDLEILAHYLSNYQITEIASLHELNPLMPLTIEVTIVLNPIAREKIKMIQEWVSEHGVTPLKDDSARGDGGTYSSTGPRFKKLFDMIFEQYTESDKEIGFWKLQGKSELFTTGDLEIGK